MIGAHPAADSPASELFVERVTLEEVTCDETSIRILYDIDGFSNQVEVQYEPGVLTAPSVTASGGVTRFAVHLACLGLTRFAAVLPREADLRAFSSFIHPSFLSFLKACVPRKWSEHRYQAFGMDYRHPVFLVDDEALGSEASPFIWARDPAGGDHKVMVASGSGKDSLLCSLLLRDADVEHDLVTCLFDFYGDPESQRKLFGRVNSELTVGKRHMVVMRDDYHPWLERRLAALGTRTVLAAHGMKKPFRTEAGEVYFGTFSYVLIQVAFGIELQVVGHEKSADRPNLVYKPTGETVAHQWAKSLEGERGLQRILSELFPGFGCVSLTKGIHDAKIIETLFRIGGDLPYKTNSCNIQKPWCCKCEKCAYVFAAFSAYGEHGRVVEAFGRDMFDDPEISRIWEELLGLRGYVAWECVGHPEEVHVYLHRAREKGVKGRAIDRFEDAVLGPLLEAGIRPEEHFQELERVYGQVYEHHHYLPHWLWGRVRAILEA